MKLFELKKISEDIVIDDDLYSKDDSDSVVTGAGQAGARIAKIKWKKVPLKVKFPDPQFSLQYHKIKQGSMANAGDFDVALIDDATGDIAVHIDCDVQKYAVPGGTLIGLGTQILSSHADYRGKKLPMKLMKCLAENGQNLFSTTLHTSGGASVWKDLIHSVDLEVYAVLPSDVAQENKKSFKIPKGLSLSDFSYVLAQGPIDWIEDVAYNMDGDNFLVVTPGLSPEMKRMVLTK